MICIFLGIVLKLYFIVFIILNFLFLRNLNDFVGFIFYNKGLKFLILSFYIDEM